MLLNCFSIVWYWCVLWWCGWRDVAQNEFAILLFVVKCFAWVSVLLQFHSPCDGGCHGDDQNKIKTWRIFFSRFSVQTTARKLLLKGIKTNTYIIPTLVCGVRDRPHITFFVGYAQNCVKRTIRNTAYRLIARISNFIIIICFIVIFGRPHCRRIHTDCESMEHGRANIFEYEFNQNFNSLSMKNESSSRWNFAVHKGHDLSLWKCQSSCCRYAPCHFAFYQSKIIVHFRLWTYFKLPRVHSARVCVGCGIWPRDFWFRQLSHYDYFYSAFRWQIFRKTIFAGKFSHVSRANNRWPSEWRAHHCIRTECARARSHCIKVWIHGTVC